ncbi:MAG: metallophosphoesterase [Spirochaetales bacterium]|nr:metallophosphoesterase [Spirochaetales bacterium]
MEILCISDHIDPLIYNESLKERFGHVDAVLSCGDLKKNYYEFVVSNLNVPFVYVLGNHSPFSIEKTCDDQENLFCGGWHADGRSVYLKELDLIVAGFGGSIKYNRGENQYTETEMLLRILKLFPHLLWNKLVHGRYLDVFITHAPPRHVNDREDNCHRGFRIFRWFIRRFKPLCMIHGHIHLFSYDRKRETSYEGVPVINTYDHYILRLPLDVSKDD